MIINSLLLITLLTTTFLSFAQQPIPSFKSKLANEVLLTDITKIGDKLVAVGARGHIIYSSDGVTWQQANVPVNVLLTAVDFKNNEVGFAVGHDATLLKTIDGGENWVIINYQPELDKPFLDVSISKTTGFAVGAYGLYFMTEDGGDDWQSVFQEELLIEDDRLYLEELKEYDMESYKLESQFLLPHFNSVTRIRDELFIAGERGFLAVSSDGGTDWQTIETEYYGSYFSIIGSANTYYLAGLRGNLFKSEDGGLGWQNIETQVPATINSSLVQGNKAYFFANSGNIFYQNGDAKLGHHVFADGKAVMAGTIYNDKLVLATEAGIKSISLDRLK